MQIRLSASPGSQSGTQLVSVLERRLLNLSQKTPRRQIPDLIKTVTDLSMHGLDLLSGCLGVVLKAKKVKNSNSVISMSN